MLVSLCYSTVPDDEHILKKLFFFYSFTSFIGLEDPMINLFLDGVALGDVGRDTFIVFNGNN